jgi:hypothetical protein
LGCVMPQVRAEDAVSRVFPVAPADAAVVGPRAVFELGYETLGERHPRKLRFRIRLDPRTQGAEGYVFDQRERRSGWLVGEPQRVLYRHRKPLRDGLYRWDVSAWNGVDWLVGRESFEIRVDSIPPADVVGLRVGLQREEGRVLLEWDPVTLDRNGAPEFVARYHVYRFERRGVFRKVRSQEIAVVEQARFLGEPRSKDPRILYYRVTAEDAAGNEGSLLEQ